MNGYVPESTSPFDAPVWGTRITMRELIALGEDPSTMDLALFRLARSLRDLGLFRA